MTQGRPIFERRATLLVLGAIFVVLLFILVWLIANLEADRDTVVNQASGLESVLVITGPNKGDAPQFLRPLGAAWGPRGTIFVSDTGNARVCEFSSRGRFLREIGRVTTDTPASQRAGALVQPAGLVVRDDGSLLVADLRAGVVREYDRSGNPVRSIQPPTTGGAREKWAPTDVALYAGDTYVADAQGIAVFSAGGEFKRRYDRAVESGENFVRPASVAVLSKGVMVVSDTNARRVVALSPGGTPVWSIPAAAEAQSSMFVLPRGVAAVADDSVLVTDAFRFGFVRVSADGRVLGAWGTRGSSPGSFEYPNDIDVRKDLVLIADKENNRVQVVRLPGLTQAESVTPDK